MKVFIPVLLGVLALGSILLRAEDKKQVAPAALQAVIAKTPEEKAKAETLLPSYPIKTCVVSGDELGGMGETVNALYGNRLVRFCCKGCVKSFNKNPAQYLPKLDPPQKTSS